MSGIITDPYKFSEGGPAGIDLDGSTDAYTKGADLTNNGDSKKFLMSVWYRSDLDSATQRIYQSNTSGTLGATVFKFSADGFHCQAKDSGGTNVVNINTTASFSADALWHNLIVGFDTTTGVVENFIAVDGVSESLNVTTFTTDGTVDFTKDEHNVGYNGTAQWWNGCLYNIWVGPGEYLAPAAAIAAFYGNGSPPALGATGNVPTGNQPRIWSPNSDLVNDQDGDGGAFTAVGTPSACATVPS